MDIFLKLVLLLFCLTSVFGGEIADRDKISCFLVCSNTPKRELNTSLNGLKYCAYSKTVSAKHKKHNRRILNFLKCCKCGDRSSYNSSGLWFDGERNRHPSDLQRESKHSKLLPIKTTSFTSYEGITKIRNNHKLFEIQPSHKVIKRSIKLNPILETDHPGSNHHQPDHAGKHQLVPMFENRTYHVSVYENSPQGTIIVQLKASLVDTRSKMKASLNSGGAFEWEMPYGTVVTFLEDKELVPVFSHDGYAQSSEGSEYVNDIHYRLENDEHDSFTIHPKTGLITVKNPSQLDYESTIRLKIMVIAEAGHASCDFATVWIHLKDVNDNSPQFSKDKYFSAVYEDAPRGSFVTQVSAEDKDAGQNGRVVYKIVSGNINQAFSIDPPNTGIIKTNADLDREQRDFYRLEIEAVDQGDKIQRTGSAVLRIQVVDINDNDPFFEDIKNVQVGEALEMNSVITQLVALDADINTSFAYSIINHTNYPSSLPSFSKKLFARGFDPGRPNRSESHDPHFMVEKNSGKVRNIKKLDREAFDRHVLTVQVSDGYHSSIGKLQIFVLDVNDNPPTFAAANYNVSVLELTPQNALVASVEAYDLDIHENSVIFYEIIGSSLFRINKNTGDIYTNQKVLLCKGQHNYVIDAVVKATDAGMPSLSSVVPLRFFLMDVNNHPPVFNSELYSLEISEHERPNISRPILKLSATDDDIDEMNTELFYFICKTPHDKYQEGSSVFFLNSTTGELFLVQSLDREQKSLYHLVVGVSNTNEKKDINGCLEGLNILRANDDFTNKTLPLYSIKNNTHSLAIINIKVLDVNDNAPEFVTDVYRTTLPEDTPVDSLVEKLYASDADMSQKISYAIIGGNDDNIFHLNSDSGFLMLRMKLDYEMRTWYILTIEAKDSGTPALSSHCSVEVTITDVNEFRPIFNSILYVGSLQEGMPPDAKVFTVRATDRDGGLYGTVHYKLMCLGDNVACPDLQVNPVSGEVRTKSSVASNFDGRTTFNYLVIAEDAGGLNATVNAVVTIETFLASKHKLRFENSSYYFMLPGNSQAGTVVGRVLVSSWIQDEDVPPVRYYFLQDSYMFTINSSSGEISLLVDLRLVSLSRYPLSHNVDVLQDDYKDDDKKMARKNKRHFPPYLDKTSTFATSLRGFNTRLPSKKMKRSLLDSTSDSESVQLGIMAEWDFPEKGQTTTEVLISIDRSCNGCSLEAMISRVGEGFLSRSHLVTLVAFLFGILFVMATIALVAMMQRRKCHEHEKSGAMVAESDHVTFRCSSIHSTVGVPSPPPFLSGRNFRTSVMSNQHSSAQYQHAPCPILCLSRTDEEVKLINNGIATPLGCTKGIESQARDASVFHVGHEEKEDDDDVVTFNASKSSDVPNFECETLKLLGNTEELILSGRLPLSPSSMESIHLFSEEGGGESGWIGTAAIKHDQREHQVSPLNSSSEIKPRDYFLPNWLSNKEAFNSNNNNNNGLVDFHEMSRNSFLDLREHALPLDIFTLIDCLPDYHSLSDVYEEISKLKDEKSLRPPKTKVTKIVFTSIDDQGAEKQSRFYPPPILTDAPPPCWMQHNGQA